LVQLARGFGAGLGAGVLFVGALELADLDVVGLDAELVEQALEVHGLDADAGDHDLTAGEKADVGGAGGGDIGGGVVAVGVGEGSLAGLAELGESGADLLGLREVEIGVGGEGDQDGTEVLVVAGAVEAVDQGLDRSRGSRRRRG
jgi:hypothetical protein